MKKLILIILLFFGFIGVGAQSANKTMKVGDFGSWDKELSSQSVISISSYITKQKSSEFPNVQQKLVNDKPSYIYELILKSDSKYNGKPTKTWIYGAKVFIDDKEATISQSPEGFMAIIDTIPTVIFRYDTSLDTINIKVTWKSSKLYQNK